MAKNLVKYVDKIDQNKETICVNFKWRRVKIDSELPSKPIIRVIY